MKLNKIIPWKRAERQLARTPDPEAFAMINRQINHVFADFLGDPWSDPWEQIGNRFTPQIDLSDRGGELRVTAELPGLDANDIEVAVEGNLLTLTGEKKDEHEEAKGDYYHSERSYGYFKRSVELPAGVDPNKVTARFKKGVLEIAIPKKPEAQTTRKTIALKSE